jgi:histidyl-tRNA synthetase
LARLKKEDRIRVSFTTVLNVGNEHMQQIWLDTEINEALLRALSKLSKMRSTRTQGNFGKNRSDANPAKKICSEKAGFFAEFASLCKKQRMIDIFSLD